MEPLQRLFDNQGNEVCLFPLENLHLSPDRNPPEHDGLALDFLGWNSLGRVYDCPCYAPFSGNVVYTGNDHNMIYWSSNPVRLVDGTLSHVSILVAHSETAPGTVGTSYVQGQLWYHTGNYGQSTGDHLHMEVALGHVMWNQAGTGLENPSHMYNVMAVNDTVISRGLDFNWREYNGGVTPTSREKKGFPWVVTRRNRERRIYGNT